MIRFRRGPQRTVLLLLSAMSFLLYVDRVNLSTAAPFLQKDLGLSNTQLGFAFSAFAYSYAIFQVIGGWFSDRIGSRLTLLLCGLIWVLTTIGTGAAGSFTALLALRFMLGIGEGATLPAAGRALTSWTPAAQRGFAQGITHSCSRLGNAVTPPIVAFLIVAFSWRTAFVVLGALTAIWVVVWWVCFRDDPRSHPRITQEDLAELPDFVATGFGVARQVPWGPVVRRMAPTMLVYFCYGWTGWLFFTWLPTFFLHGYNLNIKNTALFSSGVFFAGVVGDTVGGLISDRILQRGGGVEAARRNVMVVSFGGALIFLLPVLLTTNLYVITASLAVAFFMLELTIGPVWAVPMDVAPHYAGTASGLLNAGSAVAGIISPIVFGLVIDATGNWTLPFAGSVVLLLVGIVAAFFIKPQIPVREADSPALVVASVVPHGSNP